MCNAIILKLQKFYRLINDINYVYEILSKFVILYVLKKFCFHILPFSDSKMSIIFLIQKCDDF